jgi:2-isopropylmalate synthase
MNTNTQNTSSIDEKITRFWELAKKKYQIPANSEFKLSDRTWPDKDIEKAPIWCSVDLRDGNQSIENPMNIEQKLEYFNILVQMWFKEIEVWYPWASTNDDEFIKKLIKEKLIPDDVKIQVLTPCIEKNIKKSREILKWAKNVIIHLYNPTSPIQRKVVFERSKEETIELAEKWVDWIKKYFNNFEWNLQLQYSPESFTWTEIKFAEEICKRVINKWDSFWWKDIIFNLPATVENSTPDKYADKIEYMSKSIKGFMEENKSKVKAIISAHVHNDRWTAIASTELAIKAWADRVEWIIWVPNWERSWNTDIWTVALNMFTHWIPPWLDLSNIWEISKKISEIIKIPIHPRYPYTWELVHTAYSWGHQDAIKKWLDKQKEREKNWDIFWNVPYLPIDPKDIWYKIDIRITSQSGVSWIIYILNESWYNIPEDMKKSIKTIFEPIIKKLPWILPHEEIKEIFKENFVNVNSPISIDSFDFDKIWKDWKRKWNGTINEVSNYIWETFSIPFEIKSYIEKNQSEWRNANAVTYFEIEYNKKIYFWCWIDKDIEVSALKWLISTINIALRK